MSAVGAEEVIEGTHLFQLGFVHSGVLGLLFSSVGCSWEGSAAFWRGKVGIT